MHRAQSRRVAEVVLQLDPPRSAKIRRAVTSDRPMRGPRGPEESLNVMPTSAVGLAHQHTTKGERRVQVATELRCAGFERISSSFFLQASLCTLFSFRSFMCWSTASWRTVLNGSEPRGSLCSGPPVRFSSPPSVSVLTYALCFSHLCCSR